MIIHCAWCNRITDTKPPYGGKWDNGFTDGICNKCLEKYFPNINHLIKENNEQKEEQGTS